MDQLPACIESDDVGKARARELFQYYQPPSQQRPGSVVLPYPDPILQAHTQLAACRLNVQRCVISLMDKNTQYFVAEATKTLDLEDMTQCDDIGDDKWYGGHSMPISTGLQAWTLGQERQCVDGLDIPAYYEVLGITQDMRWHRPEYIIPTHQFRYYCGVPLTTENNINIGCLFVLDAERKSAISLSQIKVLTTCARNAMLRLQTVRDAEEKRRAIYMNMCMAEFINPSLELNKQRRSSARQSTHAKTVGIFNDRASELRRMAIGANFHGASLLGELEDNSDSSSRDRSHEIPDDASSVRSEASATATRDYTEADHQKAFDRAVHLLRQSLDLQLGGGVAFLESNASTHEMKDGDASQQKSAASDDEESPNFASFRKAFDFVPSRSTNRERVVLAAASTTVVDQLPTPFGRADSSYEITLTATDLRRFCKQYPRGKLFTLANNLPKSVSELGDRPAQAVLSAELYYAVLLRQQFPQARQVIFIPMLDANFGRWTACFAYTNSIHRVFSYDADYLPILAFCNAIRAELLRLSTVLADQQKTTYIGSVSHELRSPLHGILASIEFLQDTECTTFQRTCINTVEACAQTMMETISMQLDYRPSHAKRSSVGPSTPESTEDFRSQATEVAKPPMPKIYESTDVRLDSDLALLTEEVMDAMAVSRARMQATTEKPVSELNRSLVDLTIHPELMSVLCSTRPEVETILEIQALADRTFFTQPGAFRRIVMNLYGNSLKYTRHGFINISLRIVEDPLPVKSKSGKSDPKSTRVKLTVTDTGQGISPAFLKGKIFKAFSQENSKSPGSGLGLSIVKSLVDELQGDIDIKSIVNLGTMVTVTFPMIRSGPISSTDAQLQPAGPHHRSRDKSIAALQSLPTPPQVAIYDPALELDTLPQTQGALAVHDAVMRYLSGWFRFPTLQVFVILNHSLNTGDRRSRLVCDVRCIST